MQELLLLKGNPSGRKKRRSAAQRAATRRMLAANRYRRNPASPKKRKKARRKSVATVSRVTRKSSGRKVSRRSNFGGARRNIMDMVKNGAIMGGGALAVDVGMGLLAKAAPTMSILTSRVNADGSPNYGYFATKAALAAAIAMYGGRLTRYAPQLAAGALAVTAYELFRGMIPNDGSIPLGSNRGIGFFNPGRIVSPGIGRIMPMGKVMPIRQINVNPLLNRSLAGYARRTVNR